jgi:transposase
VFKELWKKVGLEEVLKKSFDKTSTFYDLEKAIFNLVLNRLVAPTSKRRMCIFQDAIYGMSKFDSHQYYRAMDYLIENKEEIEKGIFDKMVAQHKGEITMALFDTTSLVYYGKDPEDQSELLDYGFSKARRGDLKQIVVGVLMSQQGIPLGHETYAGNSSDVNCFEDIINKAVDKYGIKRVIFVGDRGMISYKNMDLLEKMGQEYVLGYRMRTISKKDRPEIFKKVDL